MSSATWSLLQCSGLRDARSHMSALAETGMCRAWRVADGGGSGRWSGRWSGKCHMKSCVHPAHLGQAQEQAVEVRQGQLRYGAVPSTPRAQNSFAHMPSSSNIHSCTSSTVSPSKGSSSASWIETSAPFELASSSDCTYGIQTSEELPY